MDADDSNLIPTPTETSFIILGSQGESQRLSDTEQHAEILRSLPALQMPKKKDRNRSPRLMQQPEGSSSNTSTKAKTRSADLVPDTASEGKQPENQQKTVSETELQDDDSANITVTQSGSSSTKTSGTSHGQDLLAADDCKNNQSGLGQGKEEQTSPTRQGNGSSNESSLSSRTKDTLGSYDQCELYKTQEEHIHGQRFSLFAPSLSEQDMFEDESDNDDEGRHVATPAQHIGSLQLSAEPMLVPESVDEAEYEIPPSPDIYDATHMIIPNSPTEGDSDGPETGDEEIADQTLCNLAAYNTMAEEDDKVSRKACGVADDVQIGSNEESCHLHLSSSHTARETTEASHSQIEGSQEDKSLKSYQIRGQTLADEVIVIKSQTAEGEASDSQFFALRLSPSQGEVTQAYKALEKKQCIPDTETVGGFLPRDGTLLHPSSVVSPYASQCTMGESQRQRSLVEEQTSKHKLNDNSSSVVHVAPLLTIGMIDTQSEQSPSQHRFHLEKPGAGDVGVETSEDYQKNVFQRARKSRKQPLIQNNSEDYALRQEVVWEDTEQKLVSKELCTESQGESESNHIHTSNDIREAMQLDTEPYDPNETLEPGTSSDQTKLREAVQCGGQMVSQHLITCTGQTVVAGLCPPLSVSVSVSRQDSSRVGEKQIPADISSHDERKDENALKESLSGKMRHSVQENPGKNVVQKIEDVSVPKPSVDVAGNTNHPIKVSLVEGQSPHVSCTAESTTLLQTQRQESLELASSNTLSTNKTITATSSGLYNKNANTSRRKISTGKGKLVYKGHRISRQENKMTSRSFELDTRGHSEEQLHPSKRRKIDPYTFCGSESQTAPGREEIAQNPMHWTRRHSNPTTLSPGRTPILSRKRRRLIHKKTGLLKSSSSGDSERSLIKPKVHVHFQTDQIWHPDPSPWLAPDPSETSRSPLPQYDQHFATDSVVTPSAAPPTQPIISSTLPQSALSSSLENRLTLKQNTSLSLKGSQEEKFEKWTVVTKTVMQFTTVKVEEKVVHQGKILSEKVTSLVKEEPRAVKVTSQSECEFISPYPSPSRSVSTLTSGDLGDISSSSHGSQSRSTSSDSSKASLLPSSLDRSNFGSQEQSESHHFVSPQAVVRTRTSVAQTLTSAESKEKEDQHVQPVTPSKLYTEAGAVIENPHSDVEHSASGTPQEVSTINKTGSCNHTRTFSGEGSKASDSLFSPSEKSDSTVDKSCPSSTGKGKVTKPQLEPLTTSAAVGTSAVKAVAEMKSRKSESDEISPEIPYQDKVVSSPISDIESPTTASRTIKSSDQPGSNVFAKWKDGFFYPGKIVSTDRYNRYKVVFLDGNSQTVNSSNLLLVEQLPVGQSVLVKSREDQIYECGLIVQRSPSHYIIKKDDGNNGRYGLDAVILSEDHAKNLLMNEGDEARQICPVVGPPVLPTNLADISLDNLVEGKRRTCKSESQKADTESKLGGNESASKRGKKRKLGDIEPQATSTPTPKGKMEGATKDRAPECSPLMTTGESPLTSHRPSPRKAKIGLFGDLKGPLPTKKTLFRGLVFMLTHVEKTIEQKEQEKKLLEDSSLEASTDSSTGEEEVQIPFDKDHLKEQIERGGGTVLEKFDPDLVCDSSHCYLLSSTYQRTIKYLQCLAAGVPCVSHLWIIDSCKQCFLLDYGHYILPAGISLEKKRIMEWKAGTQPLLNLRVSVVSKNDKFAEEWIKILQLAKCVIIYKFPPQSKSDESSRPEVVITDSSISPVHIKRAQQLKIPLVSSQWVIQSFINGQQVKFDGHPQYSYNYSNV
ncbi:hypothetical protein CHS0354_002777 [Potamilus streckersoni]|uniref:BRCT domain-containing protein n=1 Tax=Potamilus streckersoni TaxID=2493646 RepID=A0AAE0SN73_9BIVA|nr:hypothetical protein CHS0354_002777 [Potamilus streckersoni]